MTRPVLLAALLLAAMPARAANADLAAIDRAVEQFTGVPQGSQGGAAMPVDRRLRLNPCAVQLALGWYGARRDTVEVSCPAPGGWKLYVPLLAPRAEIAAEAIARGDAVTISIEAEGFAVSQPGEALEGGAVGAWIKVRVLTAGARPLRARVLRPGLVGMELP